jgi:hypothetical protein
MWRVLRPATVLAAGLMVALVAGPGVSAPFNVQNEIRAALDAIEKTTANLPGMGGLGAIPDPDLKAIQALLGEAERLVREARRRAQGPAMPPPDEVALIVGYARAGKAFAEAADEFRMNQGYR